MDDSRFAFLLLAYECSKHPLSHVAAIPAMRGVYPLSPDSHLQHARFIQSPLDVLLLFMHIRVAYVSCICLC